MIRILHTSDWHIGRFFYERNLVDDQAHVLAQIIDLVRSLRGLNIVGCDLVEVSPPYDTAEITSLLAANLLYELLCVL